MPLCDIDFCYHVPLQVTHYLGGENYVFWGGREGYQTLLNTDMEKELNHLVNYLLNFPQKLLVEVASLLVFSPVIGCPYRQGLWKLLLLTRRKLSSMVLFLFTLHTTLFLYLLLMIIVDLIRIQLCITFEEIVHDIFFWTSVWERISLFSL